MGSRPRGPDRPDDLVGGPRDLRYPHTPNCGACDYFNADTPITYTVNSATPEIVTVSPSPATAQRDAWSTANASVSTPTTTGTYTITASAPGFTTATSQTVTVTSP